MNQEDAYYEQYEDLISAKNRLVAQVRRLDIAIVTLEVGDAYPFVSRDADMKRAKKLTIESMVRFMPQTIQAPGCTTMLKHYRSIRRWSQDRLSAESGVGRDAICRTERGSRSVSSRTLALLAYTLNVSDPMKLVEPMEKAA